jgi:glycine/D-amino acid oxidase-like deaminating enzyme/nitrite reductase/ring-hydroxylating ferredoxin subunit
MSSTIWLATPFEDTFEPLRSESALEADVAVIGGGVTGITTALELQAAGKSVILIERDRLLSGETGRTTAHLTEMLDARYHELIADFGKDDAWLALRGSRDAIERIAKRVSELGIDCGFERVPGYLYSEDAEGVADVEREFEACLSLGIHCSIRGEIPLPFAVKRAMRVENQAQLHPARYLRALARRFVGMGGRIFERTPVRGIGDESPCLVLCDGGEVKATDVVVATDSPICNRFVLMTKVAAYRTYVLAVAAPEAGMRPGLLWDTHDPYRYTRALSGISAEEGLLIVGGEDHKVGMGDPGAAFARLEEFCRSRFKVESVVHRWSGEVLNPVDGLPYIGLNPGSEHQYVATGFAGNGMTFGTIAGTILSDLVLKRRNPYARLFSPARIKPRVSALSYLAENKDFPMCLIGDRARLDRDLDVSALAPNEAAVGNLAGKKTAVYRDEKGTVHAVSAVCTHLGCLVRWNGAERSWDCPCHGSRFAASGEVLHGPARADLQPIALEESAPEERRVLDEDGLADPAA